MNEQLMTQLRLLLADNVATGMKAHGYHWNVESDDFVQYHAFFGSIYEDFHNATDTYAEWLRMLGAYASYRLTDFFDLSRTGEPILVGNPEPMLEDLYIDMERHIDYIKAAITEANRLGENGLANFLADRQTASQKWCWQIRSSLKESD